jgi:hypothetical protein
MRAGVDGDAGGHGRAMGMPAFRAAREPVE